MILPKAAAFDFLLFALRNPRPCPILAVTEPGDPCPHNVAPGANLCTDLPKYRVWRYGELAEEVLDVSHLWGDDMVGFLSVHCLRTGPVFTTAIPGGCKCRSQTEALGAGMGGKRQLRCTWRLECRMLHAPEESSPLRVVPDGQRYFGALLNRPRRTGLLVQLGRRTRRGRPDTAACGRRKERADVSHEHTKPARWSFPW